jgi:hypothetical protein
MEGRKDSTKLQQRTYQSPVLADLDDPHTHTHTHTYIHIYFFTKPTHSCNQLSSFAVVILMIAKTPVALRS